MYSYPELLAVIIVSVGIALQSIIGIGYGLVAAPLLFLIDERFVPGPILVLGFCLSLLMVLKERQQLSWRRITPAIVFRIPGSLIGAFILTLVSQHWLQLLFGSTLLMAVLLSWKAFSIQTTSFSLAIGGFFSGVLGTATSVGGPPIALVYTGQDKVTARSELAAFFLIGTPVSIAALVYSGSMDSEGFMLSLKILPGVFIGFLMAHYLDKYLPGSKVKTALLAVSFVAAVVVLGKGVAGLL